jgi:bacteriorhodopsin
VGFTKKCGRYAVLYAVLDISAKVVFSLLLLVVRPDEALGNESAYSPIPGGA